MNKQKLTFLSVGYEILRWFLSQSVFEFRETLLLRFGVNFLQLSRTDTQLAGPAVESNIIPKEFIEILIKAVRILVHSRSYVLFYCDQIDGITDPGIKFRYFAFGRHCHER